MVQPLITKRSTVALPLPDPRDPRATNSLLSRQPKLESSEAVPLGKNTARVYSKPPAIKHDPDAYYEEDANGFGSGDDGNTVLVPNPSVNIKILKLLSPLNFTAHLLACIQSYPEAPNPCLSIDGIGALGLPLNEREAKTLISVCEQAPFGKGERNVIDEDVRDIWELSADKVHFQNPHWKQFLTAKVVPNVCTNLGVNYGSASPRCDLYKLLVYEQGSHFLPHQDTEKTDGTFATIIIVLPSKYSGAALHLSHKLGATKVFDLSENSGTVISALAWYTDVLHEVKPLTDGYRLALAYNLVHTPNALRRSLPTADDAMDKLRHVLLSWKQSAVDKAPEKFAYLLDHQYSHADLRADALKGADANLLAHLEPVARQLRFRLYLADLVLHVSGEADDESAYDGYDCFYDQFDNENADNVSMAEIYEKRIRVENLVDLDGMPCQLEVEFDETEVIRGPMDAGDPDDKDYLGYQGNVGTSILTSWRRM
ncbi:hypothetical protein JB92DRAFT_3229448 [Gautieria morchelliformis]|nr:hypothetical protein JB92DRAFT_3229448 [Gautieria morchelliformis]